MATGIRRLAVVAGNTLHAEALERGIAAALAGFSADHVSGSRPSRRETPSSGYAGHEGRGRGADAKETQVRGFDVTRREEVGSVLAGLLAFRPDVVIMDLESRQHYRMLELISSVARPGIAVIAVTADVGPEVRGRAVVHGAAAVLSGEVSIAQLLDAVRSLEAGRALVPQSVRTSWIDAWREQETAAHDFRQRLGKLSRREAQVLGQLMQGRSVGQIADLHFVGESTIRTQVKGVLAKVGVHSQAAAVAWAYKCGWHPPETGPRPPHQRSHRR